MMMLVVMRHRDGGGDACVAPRLSPSPSSTTQQQQHGMVGPAYVFARRLAKCAMVVVVVGGHGRLGSQRFQCTAGEVHPLGGGGAGGVERQDKQAKNQKA